MFGTELLSTCAAPLAELSTEVNNAAAQRSDGFVMSLLLSTCGKRARWFEPKKPAHRPYDDLPEGAFRWVSENTLVELGEGKRVRHVIAHGFPPLPGERAEGPITADEVAQWEAEFNEFKRRNGIL